MSSKKTKLFYGTDKEISDMKTKHLFHGIDLNDLDFSSKNKIGNGAYGNVYNLADNSGKVSKDYVIKKIKFNIFEKKFDFWGKKGKLPFKMQLPTVLDKRDMFIREVKTINKLEKYGITPKLYYANLDEYINIMQRMDYTLYSLIYPSDNPRVKRKSLSPEMGYKLIELVDKYFKTPIFHKDLHFENVMWSEKLGEWCIIDWGFYQTLPILENNNTKVNTTSNLHREKVGETLEVNDRILKSLWNYCKTKIKKGGPKKSDWEKLQKEIRDYIEREFPDNSVKYIKYLDSTLRGVGLKLFGGKRHKTNKKINNINRSRTKMSRKTY